jgi:hypothetical protein
MAITNSMLPETKDFLTTLGYISGGFYIVALAITALVFLYMVVTGRRIQVRDPKLQTAIDNINKYAPSIVCLSILMLYWSFKMSGIFLANKEFTGVVGLFSFLKLLIL